MILVEERYLNVSALTKYIKYKFDHDYNLSEVLLEGEISNFKQNSRGHFYFKLKDEEAQIDAIMFAQSASKVMFIPSDGMHVFVKGKVTVYEQSGSYQIYITEMKSDGLGDLFLAYEKLKAELLKLGYFDPAHKKPIPMFPKRVGVVTSPTGAVIRDIINTINRRYPLCSIILYPAMVQGEDAKFEIVKQIKQANIDNIVDVLIVGRGGGSIEDLWAFNERIVADAIYESKLPIISAVGHETDTTISDFVADKRAATPTAAAELATPSVENLKQNISYYVSALTKRIKNMFDEYNMRLAFIDKRIDANNPINTLKHKNEIVKNYYNNLNFLINQIINEKKTNYKMLIQGLEANNPLKIMDKGYSISSVDDKIITDIKDIKQGDNLKTRFKNGYAISKIMEVKENGK